MSYSDFTIDDLKETFGIKLIEDVSLFPTPPSAQTPESLAETLSRYIPLATNINTEKARSELIIAPILAEFKFHFKDRISLFSGIEFNVDASVGLKGRCDFILSKSSEQLVLSAPVLMLVEAKNENIVGGIPQCIAEMIAAKKFNEAKGKPIEPMYGVVTTGSLWRFLKLESGLAYVDTIEYPVQSLDQILGILTTVATTE
jgi:hypothetical protein